MGLPIVSLALLVLFCAPLRCSARRVPSLSSSLLCSLRYATESTVSPAAAGLQGPALVFHLPGVILTYEDVVLLTDPKRKRVCASRVFLCEAFLPAHMPCRTSQITLRAPADGPARKAGGEEYTPTLRFGSGFVSCFHLTDCLQVRLEGECKGGGGLV